MADIFLDGLQAQHEFTHRALERVGRFDDPHGHFVDGFGRAIRRFKPDRRGPGALLDYGCIKGFLCGVDTALPIDVPLGAASLGQGGGCVCTLRAVVGKRVDARALALQRTPATRRVFKDPHVVESALVRVELWILPDGTKVRGPGACWTACIGIH